MTFLESLVRRDAIGRFGTKGHTAPEAALEANPVARLRDVLAAPAPAEYTDVQLRGYADATAFIDDEQLLTLQPMSYVGFQASRAHKLATQQITRASIPGHEDTHAYRTARARRLDEIADEAFLLADMNRFPNRAPENVGDDSRTGAEVLRALSNPDAPKTELAPVGLTASRRAVRNTLGEKDGGIRIVTLSWDSIPPGSSGDPLDVAGPLDGRSLIIRVHSGCPTMNIVAGNVTIVGGGNGYGITVKDGATATVIADRDDQKFSITAEDGSTVSFFPTADSRGYQSIRPGATFHMNGRADDVTLSTDRAERPDTA